MNLIPFPARPRLARDTYFRTLLFIISFLIGLWSATSFAQEAQWIWSPEHAVNDVPLEDCHFRKSLVLRSPEQAQISIVADDAYELYVNGRKVGEGNSSERFTEHDLSRYLSRGRNLISLKVTNTRGTTAGVAARLNVKERGGEWQSFSTDSTWKTNLNPFPFWNTVLYNDSRWDSARELGKLGETAPWDVRETLVNQPQHESQTERFRIDKEFRVEQLLGGDKVGSLIAVTFNEFGHLLAAREGGSLLLIFDSDEDGKLDAVRDYCTLVKNCQGILALNGEVFVTADGPDGAGLYRLRDEDRDGVLEQATVLIKFNEAMGEHGPHGLTLGPDGMIYVIVGNHSSHDYAVDPASPYRDFYEGDLPQPRYEDPSGHASGKKAPGGAVLRTDLEGKQVQLVAGGFRNAYDLAFDHRGNLFVHDSDMESDLGTTWYRPTRLYHVTPGGEFGWRSGWAKWPDYFLDTLPAVLDTGRGSPTGAVFYNHFAFPVRYQKSLFLADWSEGRILTISLKENGASFAATSEVFLEGRPLNVTDLDVGPEGSLYFVTGGRGTEGGLYRISWTGDVPEAVKDLGSGMSVAIRQPQINSAYSRQRVAEVRQSLGDAWGKQLRGVARSSANPWYYRTRALDLMQLFGPPPTSDLLIRLSEDGNELVRGKAADLMGLHTSPEVQERLIALLADPDRGVRRKACEALLRSAAIAPLEAVTPLLVSDDRFESWAARRLLERLPVDTWRETVLESKQHRLFIQGGLALMIAHPSPENARAVTDRFEKMLSEFITDRDFIDLLRLTQVALHRGPLHADDVPGLTALLGEEFPSSDDVMNRELARLLAYLQADTVLPRYLAYLRSEAANVEKLHLAMHLRFLERGWTTQQKMEMFEFFEQAQDWEGGGSYARYVAAVARDFGKTLAGPEALAVLARGAKWPEAAVGVLYNLPAELDEESVTTLIALDQELLTANQEDAKPLRIGVLAVLARSSDAQSAEYLRYVWDNEPERRESVAMALAQQPSGDNWAYLIKSLPVLRGPAAREVIRRLIGVEQTPEQSEPLRQVILRGLEMKEDGAEVAAELLRHWTGENPAKDGAGWEEQLQAWQRWYAQKFPDRPAAEPPVDSADAKWDYEALYEHLTSAQGSVGSPIRGAVVFEKAQCIKCHRNGNRGDTIGPDLTSISKRFTRREVLESVLYPSHVISDQYASKSLVTHSGQVVTGLVSNGANGDLLVLLPSGEKVTVPADQVDEIVTSRKSVMPDNLLDALTLEEISDLFAYLGMIPQQDVARRRIETTRQ